MLKNLSWICQFHKLGRSIISIVHAIWTWLSLKIIYNSFYKKFYYLIANTSARRNNFSQPIQLEAITLRNFWKMQKSKTVKIRIDCYPDSNSFKLELNFSKQRLLGIDSLFLYYIMLSIIINAYVIIFLSWMFLSLVFAFQQNKNKFASFTYFFKLWLDFICYLFTFISSSPAYWLIYLLYSY